RARRLRSGFLRTDGQRLDRGARGRRWKAVRAADSSPEFGPLPTPRGVAMMHRMILALAFLLPAAWAQLQLFHFDGTTDAPVGNLYDAGTAATCDKLVVRFHIRNIGPQGVSVFINVAGAGFSFSVNGLNPS